MPGKRDKKPPPRAKRVVRPGPRQKQERVRTEVPDPVSKETDQDERGPRLDELVASRSVHSRRAVQQIIREGRVVLDGIIVTEPGIRIADERVYDAKGGLKLDCRPLDHALPKVTVALHKTKGVISTRKDPQRRTTVMDMIPKELRDRGLVPVGRLDAETSGLLLLSSDGDLTHLLTHPSHSIPKTYRVGVKSRVSPRQRFRLEHGVKLDGEITLPATIESIRNDRDSTSFSITITQGRNRQIRNMCDRVGLEIRFLHRITVGPIELGDLPAGEWREITGDELLELSQEAERGRSSEPREGHGRYSRDSPRRAGERPRHSGPRQQGNRYGKNDRGRSGPPERGERRDRPDRGPGRRGADRGRSGPPERGERRDRPDRGPGRRGPDRGRSGPPERGERHDRPDRGPSRGADRGRSGPPERGERRDRPDRGPSRGADRGRSGPPPERGERRDRPDKGPSRGPDRGRSGPPPKRSDRQDRPDRGRSGPPERGERRDRPDRGRSGPPKQGGRHTKPDKRRGGPPKRGGGRR